MNSLRFVLCALLVLTAEHAAAQACATPQFPTCKLTSATFNGNLGGFAGADTKCQAEFGNNYRFARDAAHVDTAWDRSLVSSTVSISQYGWVSQGSYGYYDGVCGPAGHSTGLCMDMFNECARWTSATSSVPTGPPPGGNILMGPVMAVGKINPVQDYSVPSPTVVQRLLQANNCTAARPLWCCNF
jgi:hypothetical protein